MARTSRSCESSSRRWLCSPVPRGFLHRRLTTDPADRDDELAVAARAAKPAPIASGWAARSSRGSPPVRDGLIWDSVGVGVRHVRDVRVSWQAPSDYLDEPRRSRGAPSTACTRPQALLRFLARFLFPAHPAGYLTVIYHRDIGLPLPPAHRRSHGSRYGKGKWSHGGPPDLG